MPTQSELRASEPSNGKARRPVVSALVGLLAFLIVTFVLLLLSSNVGDESADQLATVDDAASSVPSGDANQSEDAATQPAATDPALDETAGGVDAEAPIADAQPSAGQQVATEQDQPPIDLPTIDPNGPETIVGQVLDADYQPVGGIDIQLLVADENGVAAAAAPGAITQVSTSANGSYAISAPVGCYVVRVLAPDGGTVIGGTPNFDVPVCVEATIVRITVDAQVL